MYTIVSAIILLRKFSGTKTYLQLQANLVFKFYIISNINCRKSGGRRIILNIINPGKIYYKTQAQTYYSILENKISAIINCWMTACSSNNGISIERITIFLHLISITYFMYFTTVNSVNRPVRNIRTLVQYQIKTQPFYNSVNYFPIYFNDNIKSRIELNKLRKQRNFLATNLCMRRTNKRY